MWAGGQAQASGVGSLGEAGAGQPGRPSSQSTGMDPAACLPCSTLCPSRSHLSGAFRGGGAWLEPQGFGAVGREKAAEEAASLALRDLLVNRDMEVLGAAAK